MSSRLSVDEIIKRISHFDDVQVFDGRAIVHEDQTRFAFLHALKAFEEGNNIASKLPLEILLRAATTRQISVAIENIGIKNPNYIVVGALACNHSKAELLKLLEGRERKWEARQKDEQSLIKIIQKMVEVQLES
jgi:tRNA threonylcarbamoyladenosine modification (KEOPS) complex Cgi121 subunit